MSKSGDRVKLMLLSFITSICQVTVTVIAGLVGLVYLYATGDPGEAGLNLKHFVVFGFIAFILATFPFYVTLFPEKIRAKLDVIESFPLRLFGKTLFYSGLRYVVYTLQFLLLLFAISDMHSAGWQTALACIAVSYFLVTVIPAFSFTEVLVRGSVAGIVFADSGMNNDMAFHAAILIWSLNVAVPALAGSVLVFRLRFFKTDES